MNQHTILKVKSDKVIKHIWAEVNTEGLQYLFWGYLKHVLECWATSERIFNMNNTGFGQIQKNKR